jgi:ribonucleoside-diphosphate reductase alpha chain
MPEIFTYDEAYQASVDYFNNDELAAKVFVDKYALRDNDNHILEKTPTEMHWRLAKEFARIEKNKFKKPLSEEEIFGYLDRFKYIIPQGSPMYGIGNNYSIQSLGNCFALGHHPYDSYGGILYADQMLIQLSKRRAGVGLCLDNIRPKGLSTKNAARTTDGIGVFIDRYAHSTREVAQSGRRGGTLQGLSVHHPEIETFINIKKNTDKITGSNLSVIFTDKFFDALENKTVYKQQWPINSLNPKIVKEVDAIKIWNIFINASHGFAEPGALFIDTARKYSLSHCYGSIDIRFKDIIPNVCGEIWMGLDSCRLMVLNTFNYIIQPFTSNAKLDINKFASHIQIAQRLLDNMIDLEIEKINSILQKIEQDPEPPHIKQIEHDMWTEFLEIAKLGRRTGLGLTAIGDTIAALNLKYGSKESIEIINLIFKTLAINSMISSCNIAKEIGPFQLYNKDIEKDNIFLSRLFKESPELEILHNKYGRRNISLTTMSPTGSLSLLTQTTSGIEPVFLLEHTRKYKTHNKEESDYQDKSGDYWKEYTVLHHGLQQWKDVTHNNNIEESPYYQAAANDIDWKDSIKIQSTAQYWISHSISKTCNLPSNTTQETISQIFLEAYKQNCKGFTIYREGSRDGVLINKSLSNLTKERPKELHCDVHHITVQGKTYFVLIGLLENHGLYECFAGKNGCISRDIKTGTIIRKKKGFYKAIFDDDTELSPITSFCNDTEEAISRLISMSLRSKADLNLVVTQLEKVGGNSPEMHSFAKAISRVLKKYIKDGTEITGEVCPDCSSNLIRKDGCWCCSQNCGFSKCL